MKYLNIALTMLLSSAEGTKIKSNAKAKARLPLNQVEYVNTIPPELIPEHNTCSEAERERITRATDLAVAMVEASTAANDARLFTKWFGADNAEQPDANVHERIAKTYEFMKDGYENEWDVLCCDNAQGACDYCSPGTLAYVLQASGGGQQSSYTWIRFCKDGLDPDWEDSEIGLTVFHELAHLTSGVTDYAYAKTEMVKLAIESPEKARMNSDTYTMYVAQSGLSREDYTRISRASGGNACAWAGSREICPGDTGFADSDGDAWGAHVHEGTEGSGVTIISPEGGDDVVATTVLDDAGDYDNSGDWSTAACAGDKFKNCGVAKEAHGCDAPLNDSQTLASQCCETCGSGGSAGAGSDAGAQEVLAAAGVCFDGNYSATTHDCVCHSSCAACGFYANPVNADDCSDCKEGLTLTAVYTDGTGTCA